MFKNRSLQIKMVKDAPADENFVDAERITRMTPEEVEELTRKAMRQIAINVGAVIVVKIAVAVALGVIAKKLEASTK